MQTLLNYVAVASLVFGGSFLGMEAAQHEEIPPFIAVCNSDDGSGARPCIWIADDKTIGNGEGTSFFIDERGKLHLIEP